MTISSETIDKINTLRWNLDYDMYNVEWKNLVSKTLGIFKLTGEMTEAEGEKIVAELEKVLANKIKQDKDSWSNRSNSKDLLK